MKRMNGSGKDQSSSARKSAAGKRAKSSSKKSVAVETPAITMTDGSISATSYRGKVTTAGTSEGFRFDKALFKQHPEFKQKAEVRADVIGQGTMLVSLVNNPAIENEDDPMLSAFLAFMERDIILNFQKLEPVSEAQIKRARALTANVSVTDDELE